jgi:hypothetical protein
LNGNTVGRQIIINRLLDAPRELAGTGCLTLQKKRNNLQKSLKSLKQ